MVLRGLCQDTQTVFPGYFYSCDTIDKMKEFIQFVDENWSENIEARSPT